MALFFAPLALPGSPSRTVEEEEPLGMKEAESMRLTFSDGRRRGRRSDRSVSELPTSLESHRHGISSNGHRTNCPYCRCCIQAPDLASGFLDHLDRVHGIERNAEKILAACGGIGCEDCGSTTKKDAGDADGFDDRKPRDVSTQTDPFVFLRRRWDEQLNDPVSDAAQPICSITDCRAISQEDFDAAALSPRPDADAARPRLIMKIKRDLLSIGSAPDLQRPPTAKTDATTFKDRWILSRTDSESPRKRIRVKLKPPRKPEMARNGQQREEEQREACQQEDEVHDPVVRTAATGGDEPLQAPGSNEEQQQQPAVDDGISDLTFEEWKVGRCTFSCELCNNRDIKSSVDLIHHVETFHRLRYKAYRAAHENIYVTKKKTRCQICKLSLAHEYGKLIKHMGLVHSMDLKQYFDEHVAGGSSSNNRTDSL